MPMEALTFSSISPPSQDLTGVSDPVHLERRPGVWPQEGLRKQVLYDKGTKSRQFTKRTQFHILSTEDPALLVSMICRALKDGAIFVCREINLCGSSFPAASPFGLLVLFSESGSRQSAWNSSLEQNR